jgi:SAM-dependent methyltransferase
MKHKDHINLLRPANLPSGGTWADFGAGTGAFTFALREIVGPDAFIYAVDRTRRDLEELRDDYHKRFGDIANLHLVVGDFSLPLDLPVLDGAIMANSLHYFKDADHPHKSGTGPDDAMSRLGEHMHDKMELLYYFRSFIKPGGTFLLVEYNVDSGNPWVPYPLSFSTWQKLAPQAGFSEPRLLTTHPSNFLREFYSAVCYRQDI